MNLRFEVGLGWVGFGLVSVVAVHKSWQRKWAKQVAKRESGPPPLREGGKRRRSLLLERLRVGAAPRRAKSQVKSIKRLTGGRKEQ